MLGDAYHFVARIAVEVEHHVVEVGLDEVVVDSIVAELPCAHGMSIIDLVDTHHQVTSWIDVKIDIPGLISLI